MNVYVDRLSSYDNFLEVLRKYFFYYSTILILPIAENKSDKIMEFNLIQLALDFFSIQTNFQIMDNFWILNSIQTRSLNCSWIFELNKFMKIWIKERLENK